MAIQEKELIRVGVTEDNAQTYIRNRDQTFGNGCSCLTQAWSGPGGVRPSVECLSYFKVECKQVRLDEGGWQERSDSKTTHSTLTNNLLLVDSLLAQDPTAALCSTFDYNVEVRLDEERRTGGEAGAKQQQYIVFLH